MPGAPGSCTSSGAAVRRRPEAAPGRRLPGQTRGLEPGLQQQRGQPPGRSRIDPGAHAALHRRRRHPALAGATAHPHGPADPAQPAGPPCAGPRGSTSPAGRRPHPARLRAACRGRFVDGHPAPGRSHSRTAGSRRWRSGARRLTFGTGLRLPGKRAAGKAIDLLQAWRDKEPAWRWSNGKSPYANWSRYEADLNLAMVRAYSGDLVTAQHDLESMVDIAPGNGACRVRWAAST